MAIKSVTEISNEAAARIRDAYEQYRANFIEADCSDVFEIKANHPHKPEDTYYRYLPNFNRPGLTTVLCTTHSMGGGAFGAAGALKL